MAIYSAEEFKDYSVTYRENGVYVRPINYTCDSLLSRLKQAWLVFTGRCDTLKWGPEPTEGPQVKKPTPTNKVGDIPLTISNHP